MSGVVAADAHLGSLLLQGVEGSLKLLQIRPTRVGRGPRGRGLLVSEACEQPGVGGVGLVAAQLRAAEGRGAARVDTGHRPSPRVQPVQERAFVASGGLQAHAGTVRRRPGGKKGGVERVDARFGVRHRSDRNPGVSRGVSVEDLTPKHLLAKHLLAKHLLADGPVLDQEGDLDGGLANIDPHEEQPAVREPVLRRLVRRRLVLGDSFCGDSFCGDLF